jgi:hypothetical protein
VGDGTSEVGFRLTAVVDFLPALSQALATRLDGIIGYNFLKEFRVTIDYPNETLSFD